jgi:signal transduction histidine kinase
MRKAAGAARRARPSRRRSDERAKVVYRGPDRRAARVVPQPLPTTRILVVLAAAAVLGVVTDALLQLDATRPSPALERLHAAAGALAVLGGVAAAVRSRVDGFAPAWWVGGCLVAVGTLCLLGVPTSRTSTGLQFAVAVIAFGCAVRAARSTEVDTSISPAKTVVGCLLAAAVCAPLSRAFVASSPNHRVAMIAVGTLFVGLAISVQRRHRHGANVVWPGLVPLACGLGFAAFVDAAAATEQPVGPSLVLLATCGFATVEIIGELRAAGSLQRQVAYEAELLRREAERSREQVEARYAETLHEVRSSVRALEGGVRTLDRPALESVPPPDLTRALVGELERLQLLVSDRDTAHEETGYDVAEALEPMLLVGASGGWPVRWELPPHLRVSGRPEHLAQVVHGLVANATVHAPGSPIDVRAYEDHGFLLVRVEDRGPGVDRAAREAIFERDVRASTQTPGQGLGLYIARSIMRDIGGDVWVEPRVGGGASFVLAVPMACEAALEHAG